MKLSFKLLWIFIVGTMLIFYSACRKTDQTSQQQIETSHQNKIENRFFNTNRTADPTEKAIVDFLKRRNDKEKFVEKTVSQIGYPRWDKIVTTTSNSNIAGRGNSDSSLVTYYLPFVRDSQNYVNASMVIKAYPSDTTFSYKCDWQYSERPNNLDSYIDSAEYYAIFFMVLDKAVFGHTQFIITDTSLFKHNNKTPLHVRLNSSQASGRNSLMEPIEFCQEATITWQDCPYIPMYGHCFGDGGACDNCPLCTSSLTWTYCWTEWIETGGGGGGSGSGGGSSPPDCGGSTAPFAGKTYLVDPCTGGWEPIPIEDEPPYPLANQSIIDSLQGYPCAPSILAVLPNLNNITKNILQNSFGVSENFNVIFRADSTLPNYENGATSRVIKNVATNTYDIGIRLNSNMLKNSSKEFILNVMFHESIHAFMNYQWFLYNTNQIDSNTFKAQFPQIWNYKNGSNSQHIQISESYVSHLKQTVLDFNSIADSSMVRAISWVGLQATPAWINLGNDTLDIRQKASVAKYGTATQMSIYNLKKCN